MAGRPALLSVLSGIVALACGARTSLEDGELAVGANGGATGSPTSTSSGGGGSGGAVACDALQLLDPVQLVTASRVARAPEIGTLIDDVDAYLALIEAPRGVPGILRVGRLQGFTMWPPVFTAMVELDTGVMEFITGPGPLGVPTALLNKGSDAPVLATQLLTTIEGVPFELGAEEHLFVAGIEGRYLAATKLATGNYDVLHVGSYQPGSLVQSEEPLVCTTSPALAAALSDGDGFLSAFVGPNPPDPACDSANPLPGSVITFARYASPPEPGSFLELAIGDRLVFGDTIVHLALAPASFGAWAVYQAAGINARVQPAIAALQIDAEGRALDPGLRPFAISADGVSTPQIALTTIGDQLVVAWTDNVDPSSPTIIVQLVEPDGSLGPQASIPTHVVWQTGRLRVTTSIDQRSVLVAWEGGLAEDVQIGLARLDCAPPPAPN